MVEDFVCRFDCGCILRRSDFREVDRLSDEGVVFFVLDHGGCLIHKMDSPIAYEVPSERTRTREIDLYA